MGEGVRRKKEYLCSRQNWAPLSWVGEWKGGFSSHLWLVRKREKKRMCVGGSRGRRGKSNRVTKKVRFPPFPRKKKGVTRHEGLSFARENEGDPIKHIKGEKY